MTCQASLLLKQSKRFLCVLGFLGCISASAVFLIGKCSSKAVFRRSKLMFCFGVTEGCVVLKYRGRKITFSVMMQAGHEVRVAFSIHLCALSPVLCLVWPAHSQH